MASSSFMLISLALLFMVIAPSFGEKHTKLKKICSKTFNHHMCMKLMKADSRTSDANNRLLTEIAIDLAYNKAQDIYRDLTGVIYYSYDSQYREPCSKNYNDAIRDLEQTKTIFTDGDYDRIPDQVSKAADDIRDCKNQFDRSDINDSKELKKRNTELEVLCDMVKASSKYLRHKNDNDN
ncbi:pectinesterase inhibitor-like [Actinidia eriantha]|uniref:pectinesterase inhibitor-like n=1 Tax=Actinidia eriantha TaxID=165200 RepID=UPI0025866285|nr:pectinesterase inhibitor-like [Actinidia eriantha]